MNSYCTQVFHQLEIAVNSTAELISSIEESEWDARPTDGKFSVGELIGHIALICEADRRIADGSSESEMSAFYLASTPDTLEQAKTELFESFERLQAFYLLLNEQQLHELCTSYWGVTYSRYEWLLETLVHVIHHRGQLHAMLVHCLGKQPDVVLFE
ncbi:DinB family protein [Planococcus sp. ISL-109]|uniref:DinB family protein n=1 Tax=Planococcus sp. ISL-109 TaxID=2819166 RepID=UPI001BE805E9|nr:DinB family protein [Planococcus sp. ISL-109]MBT2582802.1 DinB family protein [Planococcus sp. ISL-109]